MNETNSIPKVYTKADNGKLSRVVEFGSGATVEIPINTDGSVKWYEDKLKQGSQ